jgi:DNA uptake protein ComE-like DNA-binding protein
VNGRQPSQSEPHPNGMRTRIVCIFFLASTLALFSACSPNQSPDQIRQETAKDAATLKQDTKAVAEGVKEGLSSKRTVDLNKASKDDLSSLPGISSEKADRIIAERPYASAHQLVTRHILTEDEYSRIQDRVVVTH